jgi:DNA (cytosine-5)-methyltransferase 1
VIDLFAGPGGLAEGFSACRDIGGHQPFNIVLSVEKERAAHSTLRLRSFLRQFDEELPPEYYIFLNEGGAQPDWARAYPEEWSNACEEALCAELGTPSGNALIRKRLDKLKRVDAPRVVIGGPPCQAYSLVGRARNRGKADYVPEHDHRHFLYQEYIGILEQVQPEAFVMENVKGMLSSSIEGDRIFERVLADLRCAGGSPGSYELFAIKTDPKGRMTFRKPSVNADFLLLSEQFGIPQARHRVIIVGLRRDIALRASFEASSAAPPEPATLRHVLAEMPPLRSGLSVGDSEENWRNVVVAQMRRVCSAISANDKQMDWDLLRAARTAMATFRDSPAGLRCSENMASSVHDDCPVVLRDWLIDPLLSGTANHATRRHMADDLARYFFCSVFAQVFGRAPKSREFPPLLAPTHASWTSGAFADRFRSQPWEAPATTITSHISKDGHYFIHPDPLQCRSLTVREAARIQTFPDNYLFLGNRTEQYVQVGNAVPPFLANQIAQTLWSALSPALITKQDGAGPSTPVLA